MNSKPRREIQSPKRTSLEQVAEPMDVLTSTINDKGTPSDDGSSSDTITVRNIVPLIADNQLRKQSISSRRDSSAQNMTAQPMIEGEDVVSKSEACHGDGGENMEQQGVKRRKVDDQLSSCETCKHRKVKCDRTQPSCLRCQRSKQECVYKQKKKPGLRAGIGKELEERLDRVESMLASHAQILARQAVNIHHLSSPSNPSLKSHGSSPASPLNVSPYNDQSAPRGSPITNGSGYASNRNISLSNGREVIESPSNSTSTNVYRERTQSASHLDIGNSHCAVAAGIQASSASKSFDPELPPDDLLLHLVELYFIHVQPSSPILHRETTINLFFSRPASEQQPEDITLLFAIASAALRFSTDPRLNVEWLQRFKRLAKQRVVFSALENPSIQSLRSMVILVLDTVGSTNGPAGWGLIAFTARMIIHLGLNTEPSNSPAFVMNGNKSNVPSISTWGAGILPEPKDWIEQEARRRLFWMVYILDIYTSLGTSLDLTLDEKEIERLLPCQDELWDHNEPVMTRWFRNPSGEGENSGSNMNTLSSFSFLVEIVGLLGKIHQFLRKPIDINNLSDVNEWQTKYRTLDKALTNWKYSLPMQYGNLTRALNIGPTGVDPGWVLLHAAYNTAVIRLHSVAAYPTNRSSIFGPSYSAGQRCLSAVENVAALTRIVLDNDTLSQLGSTFAFTLWVSARLLLVHASTAEYPLIPDIQLFLDALHEMGRVYDTAERYATILQRVLDELSNAVGEGLLGKEADIAHKSGDGSQHSPGGASTNGEEESKKSSCVAILADMRRTAFAVDVLISQQTQGIKPQSTVDSYDGALSSGSMFSNSIYAESPIPVSMQQAMHPPQDTNPSTSNSHIQGAFGQFSSNPQLAALIAAGGASSNAVGQHNMMHNPHTIEYLDVFNWFNFPRVPVGTSVYLDNMGGGITENAVNGGVHGFDTIPSVSQAEQSSGDWLYRS